MDDRGRMRSINGLVGRLYRSALQVPLERFRESALHDLDELIPFDAALWGTGMARAGTFHSLSVVGLDNDAASLLRTVDPMFEAMARGVDASTDAAYLVPEAHFRGCDIHRRICHSLGVRQALGAGHREARKRLCSLVVLFRRDHRFTVEERRCQGQVIFHLMNAVALAYSVHLDRVGGGNGAGAAICDRRGMCYDAQPGFRRLVKERFPDWGGGRLPFALPSAEGETAVHRGLRAGLQPVGDLYCLRVWQEGPMDRLTHRERQIVTSVCRGLSYKEVARPLGIAPSTVSNHLYRVFGKLGVASRTELAKLVIGQ